MDYLKLCASCCHNVTKNDDKYLGDETEVSIYKYLEKYNIDYSKLQRTNEYPFDSERKMMSTINNIDGKNYSFTKGSLDSILNASSYYIINNKILPLTNEYKDKILKIEKS